VLANFTPRDTYGDPRGGGGQWDGCMRECVWVRGGVVVWVVVGWGHGGDGGCSFTPQETLTTDSVCVRVCVVGGGRLPRC